MPSQPRPIDDPTPLIPQNFGAVCAFTRQPKALARLERIECRPAARFVMHVLVTFCGKLDSLVWVEPRTIRKNMPRSRKVGLYSLTSVERSLREWRDAGLLTWAHVAPMTCFPTRTRAGELVPGAGRFTQSGGRVFVLNLPALRGQGPAWTPPQARIIAADVQARLDAREGAAAKGPQHAYRAPGDGAELPAETSTHDGGTAVIHDCPSDRLCSPAENKSRIPPSDDAGTQRPAAAHEASETPPSAPDEVAPLAEPAAPPVTKASETPPSASASRAAHPRPRFAPPSGTKGGRATAAPAPALLPLWNTAQALASLPVPLRPSGQDWAQRRDAEAARLAAWAQASATPAGDASSAVEKGEAMAHASATTSGDGSAGEPSRSRSDAGEVLPRAPVLPPRGRRRRRPAREPRS